MTLSVDAYRMLLRAGMCPQCGGKPAPGRKQCQKCLDRNREYARRSRSRKRSR